MARAACKFIVHFSMSFCTTRTSFRKNGTLLSCRPSHSRLRGQTPDCRTVPLPLPRRTTFGFRNALHLLEARDSVTYVRGIFQRFLALVWESELGCGYPITSWLG